MKIKRFVVGEISSNCYIINDEKTSDAVLIDAGDIDARIDKYIDDNNLSVKYVLLTHGHFDHILGCEYYAQKYNAKIVIGEIEANQIFEINAPFGDYLKDMKLDDLIVVKNGETITFGDTVVKVIHTPGHTSGGVCYLIDKALFSGDTLLNLSIGRTDFLTGDFEAIINSIKSLYLLDEDTVIHPGHGFTSTIGKEKINNPYVRGES